MSLEGRRYTVKGVNSENPTMWVKAEDAEAEITRLQAELDEARPYVEEKTRSLKRDIRDKAEAWLKRNGGRE